MATNFSLIEFLMEQIESTGIVTYKKMFGEYMIYLNAKPIFIVCDDTLFVKVLPETDEYMSGKELGKPYESCKQPHYVVEDIDDRELLCNLATALEKVIPVPKPRKKKA